MSRELLEDEYELADTRDALIEFLPMLYGHFAHLPNVPLIHEIAVQVDVTVTHYYNAYECRKHLPKIPLGESWWERTVIDLWSDSLVATVDTASVLYALASALMSGEELKFSVLDLNDRKIPSSPESLIPEPLTEATGRLRESLIMVSKSELMREIRQSRHRQRHRSRQHPGRKVNSRPPIARSGSSVLIGSSPTPGSIDRGDSVKDALRCDEATELVAKSLNKIFYAVAEVLEELADPRLKLTHDGSHLVWVGCEQE